MKYWTQRTHTEGVASPAAIVIAKGWDEKPSSNEGFSLNDTIDRDDRVVLELLALQGDLRREPAFVEHRPKDSYWQRNRVLPFIWYAKNQKAWSCYLYLIQYLDEVGLREESLSRGRLSEESQPHELCKLEIDIRKMIQLGNALRSAGIQVDEGVIECKH